jgi:glycosyltransferase involved in cell wall biosynthesis
LMALHEVYPDAPIYTSVWDKERTPRFAGMDIRTSFLQKWPWATTKHQLYPTLRPLAFESFDLSEYDIVISITSAEAKDVMTAPNTFHICYCNTPIRYYWNDYQNYLKRLEFGLLNPLVRLLMPGLVSRMRQIDYVAAQRVDTFIGNSHTVSDRIKKYYGRESVSIYPPVEVNHFKPSKKKDYYLSFGRLVPYKRTDLAVEAATELGLPLKVAGSGPDLERLKKIAGPTVEFLGRVSEADHQKLMAEAKAVIFCAEEDFGIVPVEAMAAGTPVIAFGKGGATETVVEGETGTFFAEQSQDSLVRALKEFDPKKYKIEDLRSQAEKFSTKRFKDEMKAFVEKSYAEHQAEMAKAGKSEFKPS